MKYIRTIIAFTLLLVLAFRAESQMIDPNRKITPEELKEMEKAAKKGDYTVQLGLGSLYVMGAYGVDKNVDKALEWAKKARDKGLKDGDPAGLIVYLELLIMEEDNIPNAKGEIVTWGARGELMGNPMCITAYGAWLVKEGEIIDGLTKLNRSAGLGDLQSMNLLTYIYLGNEGLVPPDYDLAFKWANTSAELMNPQGMKNLAMMYINGWGTPKDENKAIEWGDKAMAAGLDCSDVLINAYLNSPDYENQKKGFDLLMTHQDQPNPVIWYCLGMCYEKGIGTEKNDALAVQWYEMAKMGENEDAEIRLLTAKLYGELGIDQNVVEAIAELDEQGSFSANVALFDWYSEQRDGKAMLKYLDILDAKHEQSPEKSPSWFTRGYSLIIRADIYSEKENGVFDIDKEKECLQLITEDDGPYYHLAQGILLSGNKFGELDYVKANEHFEWLINSPEAGNIEKWNALNKLSAAYRYGRGVEIDEVKADRYLKEVDLIEKSMDFGDGHESTYQKMKNIGL